MQTTRFHSLLKFGLGVTLSLALTSTASAFPIGSPDDPDVLLTEPQTWEEIEAAAVDFKAIVALSNCSGSLVKFTTSKTTDSAMVLSNGHCIGTFPAPGTAQSKVPSSRTFTLLNSSGSSLGTLRAKELSYATMTGTDVSLYKLTETYAQLSTKYRVAPLVITNARPTAGTNIRIVSGYWRRIYSCSIDHFAYKLKEGGWTMDDSINYKQPGCSVIGGTSGSPVINADTYEVIGVNNTINESGAMCTLNNPCEVDMAGKQTAVRGAGYAQQIYQVYTCLDANNNIDLNRAGCKLQK